MPSAMAPANEHDGFAELYFSTKFIIMNASLKTAWKMWGLVLIALLIGTTYQCKKDSSPIPTTHLPGLNYLGRGYDFFGEYADGNSAKNALIAFDKYDKAIDAYGTDYAIPSEVDYLMTNKNTVNSTYGQTILDYQKEFSSSLGISGSYLGFNASIDINFDKTYSSHSDYSFITVKNLVSRWRITLPIERGAQRAMLTSEAASDIENLAPDDLFYKYGHFMVAEAIIGARADYNASSKSTSTFYNTDFKTAATLAYNSGTGKISSELSDEQKEQLSQFYSKSNIICNTKGGASQYGMNILAGDYDTWLATVENDPVLCDFTERSLIPLWELTTNEARAAQLKERFEELVEEHKIIPTSDVIDEVISEIRIVQIPRGGKDANDAGLYNAASLNTPGYILLRQNVNGNKPDYATFIAYKLKPFTTDVTGYSNLIVDDAENSKNPEQGGNYGFSKIPSYAGCDNCNDLNYGIATGLYLWGLPAAPSEAQDYIRGLQIVIDPATGDPPAGYTWVVDEWYHERISLTKYEDNSGATPEIYLAFTREKGN